MKKYLLIIIIISLVLVGCESKNTSETQNIDSTAIIQKNRKEEQKRIKIETKKQIEHLEKIIEQNKQKLNEYEHKISIGDTFELKGLPQYVEDLKSAIANKEERLKKLKN
ncbi:hypothetical protein EP342_02000 [bacterium]|nr:MAG: hypothetical protein EP342_02000 [bacterium]